MTPLAQTQFYNPAEPAAPGNCLQAAIASLLDLPIDEVPHFVGVEVAGGQHFWTHLRAWVHQRGYRLTTCPPDEPLHGEYYLGVGGSPRASGVAHIAIYRDGTLCHDPHPDGTGVVDMRQRWLIRSVTL